MSHPFNDSIIRDWLFQSFQISGSWAMIFVEGFGPFEQNNFVEFLKIREFHALPFSPTLNSLCDTLIVGQYGWDEKRLNDLIEERVGRTLKIYSQEMFLSYLLSGVDPFDGSLKLLKAFAYKHPALEYLMDVGFRWPSTFVYENGDNDLDETEWPKNGVLKKMGYTVARSSKLSVQERRECLINVFESANLPQVKSRAHMSEWGNPNSCQRLEKIANSLASFCRLAKSRTNSSELTISRWELDINWLRKRYYIKKGCNFSWPSTDV